MGTIIEAKNGTKILLEKGASELVVSACNKFLSSLILISKPYYF